MLPLVILPFPSMSTETTLVIAGTLMSSGDDFMIVYSDGDKDLWVTSHSEWEVLKLEEDDAASLSNCITLNDSNAEIYDISFNAWRMLKSDPLLTFIPAGGTDGWEDIADYYDQD